LLPTADSLLPTGFEGSSWREAPPVRPQYDNMSPGWGMKKL
jgi:hypothetical protein